jgi:hypothetical protein
VERASDLLFTLSSISPSTLPPVMPRHLITCVRTDDTTSPGVGQSPCHRAAQGVRSRRRVVLPSMYRDMVSLDPFIGPTLNGRVTELERRLRQSISAPPKGAATAGEHWLSVSCLIRLLTVGRRPQSNCVGYTLLHNSYRCRRAPEASNNQQEHAIAY